MSRLRLGLGPLQLSPVRPQRKGTNQPPVVANAIPDRSASEGTAFSFQFAANAFSDPDGDALTYAATLVGGGALPAWLTFTPATRTFSGTPGAGDFADLSIRVTATDPGGLSAHDDFVLAVNGKPVVANAIPDRSASEGTGFSFQFAANAFSDPDGDALTYAATLVGGGALPAWLTFTPATRTFSGTPGAGDFADLSIRVTATDPGGLSAHDDFLLAVNGKPVVANRDPEPECHRNARLFTSICVQYFLRPGWRHPHLQRRLEQRQPAPELADLHASHPDVRRHAGAHGQRQFDGAGDSDRSRRAEWLL